MSDRAATINQLPLHQVSTGHYHAYKVDLERGDDWTATKGETLQNSRSFSRFYYFDYGILLTSRLFLTYALVNTLNDHHSKDVLTYSGRYTIIFFFFKTVPRIQKLVTHARSKILFQKFHKKDSSRRRTSVSETRGSMTCSCSRTLQGHAGAAQKTPHHRIIQCGFTLEKTATLLQGFSGTELMYLNKKKGPATGGKQSRNTTNESSRDASRFNSPWFHVKKRGCRVQAISRDQREAQMKKKKNYQNSLNY